MGAAVDKGMHHARLIAIDDDRGLTEIGGAKIAWARDLDIEREKVPCLAAKDAVLLFLIELGIVIKPIRHPAIIEGGPDRSGCHRHPPGRISVEAGILRLGPPVTPKNFGYGVNVELGVGIP